jgi:DNA-binding CsgD family transcriptional regulator
VQYLIWYLKLPSARRETAAIPGRRGPHSRPIPPGPALSPVAERPRRATGCRRIIRRRMGTQGRRLSTREWEVAHFVAEGMTNGAIATRLYISERTVESHLERIRAKLGIHHRSEIAGWIALGVDAPPGERAESPPHHDAGEERERLGDERQRRADERERRVDVREARVDAREARADQREAALDERERLLEQRKMRTNGDT